MRARRAVVGYGLTAVGVGLTVAAALELASATGLHAARVLLIAPVALAAWYGGWGPGLLATALGGLALDYFFEEPQFSLEVDRPHSVLVFLLVASLIALGNARLSAARGASETARRELEAVLDAADDSVIAYALDGRVTRINRHGRERFLEWWGAVPTTVGEMRAMVQPIHPDGAPLEALPDDEALRGLTAETVLARTDANGRVRRFSVRAVPIRGADDRVRGALSIWHDVTELHAAVTALAQIDATLKTVQRVSHEIGNALAPAVGWSDLLPAARPDEAVHLAERIGASVERVARVLDRIRKVVRFEESEVGGVVMLDLDAASGPDASIGRHPQGSSDGSGPD